MKTKLAGVDANKLEVKNQNNERINAATAVFPIIKELSDNSLELVGTGFFISGTGIFVTAKHVIMDVVDEKSKRQINPVCIVQIFPEGGFFLRPIFKAHAFENNADIAVCTTMHLNNKTGGDHVSPRMSISIARPKVGDRVTSYCFPDTKITRKNEITRIATNPSFFSGHVVEVFPSGRDSNNLPNPCFQTDMHIHGGASGGPVFNDAGNVIGVNSTSFGGETDLAFVSLIEIIQTLSIEDSIVFEDGTRTQTVADLAQRGLISLYSD